MCILVVVRPDTGDAGLIVGANRDELLARPWQPPDLLAERPPVFGGRDLVGGGSWLAVNLAARFVVGVTNARLGARPGELSRGRLVVDAAAQPDVAAAVRRLAVLDLTRFGAFNLVIADAGGAWIASNAPATLRAVAGPVVAVGNDALDAPSDRVCVAAERAREIAGADPRERPAQLADLLADHGGRDPLCRHGDRYGTVCSTIATLVPGADSYLFASGRPCTAPFEALALPVTRAR